MVAWLALFGCLFTAFGWPFGRSTVGVLWVALGLDLFLCGTWGSLGIGEWDELKRSGLFLGPLDLIGYPFEKRALRRG